MKNLVRGAMRAVVVIMLAVGLLDAAVWLLDGNDPAANADIGIGLVPLGVIVMIPASWAFLDAGRHSAGELRVIWGAAALVIGIAAMSRAMDSVDDAIFAILFGTACIALSAWVGAALRVVWRRTSRRVTRPDA